MIILFNSIILQYFVNFKIYKEREREKEKITNVIFNGFGEFNILKTQERKKGLNNICSLVVVIF